MRVLGFMTGTSLDAVDLAVIETDGEAVQALGSAGEVKLTSAARRLIERATADALQWDGNGPEPPSFEPARSAVTEAHLGAALDFIAGGRLGGRIDLAGAHGQTVLHRAPSGGRPGRSVQLLDAEALARGLGLPVVHDFRSADLAAGGEGAPLAPVYHAALAELTGLDPPLAVLNLGGVANITFVDGAGRLRACDAGPGNGMIDLVVQSRTGARFDAGGAVAAGGTADERLVGAYLHHPFFGRPGPKSLDRYDFSLAPVAALPVADALATLTAFAASAIAVALRRSAERPAQVVATGGGRHNLTLMRLIALKSGIPIVPAEAVGWRGDSTEAEAFAFLAARHVRGLPSSFPETTGVAAPLVAGRVALPAA